MPVQLSGPRGGGAGGVLEACLKIGHQGWIEAFAHRLQNESALGTHVLRQPVVHPHTLSAVLKESSVEQVAQVPGGFRLGYLQNALEVAYAQFRLIQ